MNKVKVTLRAKLQRTDAADCVCRAAATAIPFSITMWNARGGGAGGQGACFLSFFFFFLRESEKNISNSCCPQGESPGVCLPNSVRGLETLGSGDLSQQLLLFLLTHHPASVGVIPPVCLAHLKGPRLEDLVPSNGRKADRRQRQKHCRPPRRPRPSLYMWTSEYKGLLLVSKKATNIHFQH